MNTSYSTAHATLVNCIDGTVQVSAIDFVRKIWNVQWVDVVTDGAPERILSDAKCGGQADHIHTNIETSLCDQRTQRLAIAAHSGCDINEEPDDRKIEMLRLAVNHLKHRYTNAQVIGIWIDHKGLPSSVSCETR